jgi:predicted nucleic acid-binding protein
MNLFDSMVLIHALQPIPSGKDDKSRELRSKCEASRDAAERADRIFISAISLIEVSRGVSDSESDNYLKLYAKFDMLPVDAAVAQYAAEILKVHRTKESVCKKCLGPKKGKPCKLCNNQRALFQRFNDVIIVATAETNSNIDVLYTYDDGIKYFSAYAVNCRIQEPPHPLGPLFEHAQEKDRLNSSETSGPEVPHETHDIKRDPIAIEGGSDEAANTSAK